MATRDVDLCIVGAGAAGLSVAAVAAQLGVRTILIERGRMGGDCLNVGCVPSKALLAAAAAAAGARDAGRFGIEAGPVRVDWIKVRDHVRRVIAEIAPNDSEARFQGLGVTVIKDTARFTAPELLTVGERSIRARRFVLATGSRPLVPPIPGLDAIPFLTNETVFDLDHLPERLLVLGGGPIGVELAQAFRRLGAEVAVIEADSILNREDPELVETVRTRLRGEGIAVLEGGRAVRVEGRAGALALSVQADGELRRVEGTELLVAVGRTVETNHLGLDAAGIEAGPRGIRVNAGLRTTNRKVYAIGDCVGGPAFTHVASDHAGVVIRNALFRLPARASVVVPRVTFTDPELAHVGLTEAEARRQTSDLVVLRWPFAENDRARAERVASGSIKILTTRRGRVLGASLVGPHAGELVGPWVLAIRRGLRVRDLAETIVAYPTLAEVNRRVAQSFFAPKLFSPFTRRLVRLLGRLG